MRVTHYAAAFGGDYPGDYVPSVTVDLSVLYPPFVENYAAAVATLNKAYLAARGELNHAFQKVSYE